MSCPSVLPTPLINFLNNAPLDPTVGAGNIPPSPATPQTGSSTQHTPGSASSPVPTPTSVPTATTTPTLPSVAVSMHTSIPSSVVSSTAQGGVSVSDAFVNIDNSTGTMSSDNVIMGTKSTLQSELSEAETADISSGISAISAIAKKTVNSQQAALTLSERTADSMKTLLAKMKSEKVSMAAAVERAESELSQVQHKQNTVMSDIESLRQELVNLQAHLAETTSKVIETGGTIGQLETEKANLQVFSTFFNSLLHPSEIICLCILHKFAG